MADLTSWAPLATGAAALVGAFLNWRLGTARHHRLKLAVEVADQIPPEQRADWDRMIYRDVERIMERARLPGWITPAYIGGWFAVAVGALRPPLTWWVLGGGLLLAVPATIAMVGSSRREKRDQRVRLQRRQAAIDQAKHESDALNQALLAEKTRLDAKEKALRTELADMQIKVSFVERLTVRFLMLAGATKAQAKAAVAYDLDEDDAHFGAGAALLERHARGPIWRVRRVVLARAARKERAEADPRRRRLRAEVDADVASLTEEALKSDPPAE